MARKLVGIRQNVIQVYISGARVAFDPRTTAEVCETRDERNYKSEERLWRKSLWQANQRATAA
jgi:hypothetical protein